MRRPLALLLPLLAPACGGKAAEAPTWTALAEVFRPVPLADRLAAWGATDVSRIRPDAEMGGSWLEWRIPRSAWVNSPHPDEWEAPVGPGVLTEHLAFTRVRLLGETVDLEGVLGAPAHEDELKLPPDTFFVDDARIRLALAPGTEPPDELTLALLVETGRSLDGRWRVSVGRSVGDAIPVLSGTFEEVAVSIPAGRALRFATSIPETGGAETTFRISADGEPLFEHRQTNEEEHGEWHVVPLPASRERESRLRFEVSGPVGFGYFVDPVIGPEEIGTYAGRPWSDARPNLVVLLADTFRADNLAIYGGDPDLAPELNAFAERSLRFLQARSPASWTLPSISSLMTGRFPPQHGAVVNVLALPRDLVTVAEVLRDRGYRTMATTDGGMVSNRYQVDQGFAWYQETSKKYPRDMARTYDLAREFVARDDGRPALLFVHTYRVHAPYRPAFTEEPDEFKRIMDAIENKKKRNKGALPHAAELERLYRSTVPELDQLFTPWLGDLEAAGFFEPGFLLLTSDHGEAFGEHGEMWHQGRGWEEQIRIPMLLYGKGIEPGDVRFGANLVDVAPTLTALAGVPAHPSWMGTSLASLDRDRPSLFYDLGANKDQEVTIIEGPHKVSASYDPDSASAGEILRAFDLGADPDEERNQRREAWSARLYEKCAPLLEAIANDTADRVRVDLPKELQRALAELGY